MAEKLYKLIGADGREHFSKEPGLFGGHTSFTGKADDNIYVRLDCGQAKRLLESSARDIYIAHRVFFKDEETAIAAGFRPCGSCMRESYKLWRAGKLEERFGIKKEEG